MRIFSPITHFFPGNSLFQLFQIFSSISSHSSKKKTSCGGGTKIIIPGWSMFWIKHKYSVQAFRESFSVVFTLQFTWYRDVAIVAHDESALAMLIGVFDLFMPSLISSYSMLLRHTGTPLCPACGVALGCLWAPSALLLALLHSFKKKNPGFPFYNGGVICPGRGDAYNFLWKKYYLESY